MVNKIIVWGIGKEYRDAISRNLLWDNSLRLVDKDAKRGCLPSEINKEEYGFIAIFSHKYYNEISANVKEFGMDWRRIIPIEFFDMQRLHHKKYSYLEAFKRCVESMQEIQVLSNWNEYNGSISLVLKIENAYGKECKIRMFAGAEKKKMQFVDLRTKSKIASYEMMEQTGEIDIEISSDCMLLEIICLGVDIPHLAFQIERTEWDEEIDTIEEEDVKRIFIENVKKLHTYFPFHEEDYLLLRNFRNIKGICALDCGANYGQSAMSFLLNTDYMRVCSFEANPKLIRALKILEQKYRRIKVYPYGLSDQKEEMTFYYCSNRKNISGSFIKKDLEGRLTSDDLMEEVTVWADKLDALLVEEQEIVFAKIDVEGYEDKVIVGMKEIINKMHPILLIEKNASNMQKIQDMLRKEYNFYYFDYVRNLLTKTNNRKSINYWCIPKSGTNNPKVNDILMSLLEE